MLLKPTEFINNSMKAKMRKNIIYNTTRQWNPGDEFILLGCRNILNELMEDHNSIIFNRNPEISSSINSKCFRGIKLPDKFWEYPDILQKKAYYKIDFIDNSIKFDSDLSYADLAVFAGTPNWGGAENANFYEHIIKNSLPSVILGVGSMSGDTLYEEEVIKKSFLFTVRDKMLLECEIAKKYNAIYLPCPAMQAVKIGCEKTIDKIENIGLVFGVGIKHSVAANCVDDKTYNYIKELYINLIKKYKNCKFHIICHYIDEVSVAHEIFKDFNVPILYSYDSIDYIDMFKTMDFVISPRVHGCGLAASLGIPSICIGHDGRAGTCEGFLSTFINNDTIHSTVYQIINDAFNSIKDLNLKLINHKKGTFNEYVKLLSEKFESLKPQKYKEEVKYIPTARAISKIEDIPSLHYVESKIPKTIYYVWDGEKPHFVNACITSWKVNCPDFEIVEINNQHTLYKKAQKIDFFNFCQKKKLFAPMSDILRLLAIYEYGGIYLDIDVQLLKPLDYLLYTNFVGIEAFNYVNGAILAFEPKHRLIKRVLDFYSNEVMQSQMFIIPEVIKHCISELYHQDDFSPDQNYVFEDLTLFSKKYFYPFYYNEEFTLDCISKNTYSIHWWRGSWNGSENQDFVNKRGLPKPLLKFVADYDKNIGFILKIKQKDSTRELSLLNAPVLKIIAKDMQLKYYLFGKLIFTRKFEGAKETTLDTLKIYAQYYRYKVLSKILIGKKRKYYKDKYREYKSIIRKIPKGFLRNFIRLISVYIK